jgi:PAS domain S-box-containing protein
METIGNTQGSDGRSSERTNILGNLAQRLQDGLRGTVLALGDSYAQRLAALVESSDDGILSLDLEGTIATWNHGAAELFGYAADEIIGKPVTLLIPADRKDEEPGILERVARGERIQHHETLRLTKDGRTVAVSLSVSPIEDAAGTVIGASKIVRDVTARKLAEAALAKRAEEQAALYEFTDRLFRATSANDAYNAALDAILRALGCERASVLLFDDAGVMRFVAWRGLSDGYRKAVEGHSPWMRGTKNPQPVSIANVEEAVLDPALKASVNAECIGALAFIPLTANGQLIGKFMTYYAVPHEFSTAEIELAVTIARQLGFALERRQAEETRKLLLGESQHRIKNTLATVQAMVGQTLQRCPPEERDALVARLSALSEAHDLLTQENWSVAQVRDVIGRALKPFETARRDCFVYSGPLVWVPAQPSLTLTMCLHELATNAAKYGALSNGTGRVHVSWDLVEPRKLKLSWQEAGGPPVSAPARTGFGSRLIEASFSNGETCLDFQPDGLRCSFELPL